MSGTVGDRPTLSDSVLDVRRDAGSAADQPVRRCTSKTSRRGELGVTVLGVLLAQRRLALVGEPLAHVAVGAAGEVRPDPPQLRPVVTVPVLAQQGRLGIVLEVPDPSQLHRVLRLDAVDRASRSPRPRRRSRRARRRRHALAVRCTARRARLARSRAQHCSSLKRTVEYRSAGLLRLGRLYRRVRSDARPRCHPAPAERWCPPGLPGDTAQNSGVGLYTVTWVTLPDLPDWITPMAADDEHTDLSNGIAVPLQVNLRPPDSGMVTLVAVAVRLLDPCRRDRVWSSPS